MNIKEWMRYAISYLKYHTHRSYQKCYIDVCSILQYRMNLSTIQLITHAHQPIHSLSILYQDLRKCAQLIPIPYIIHKKDFWSFSLLIYAGVFIPRPDSESVIEAMAMEHQKEAQVLDLCTGSGALAIALAQVQPTWKIIGSDYSQLALQVAQRNSQKLFINIDWKYSYWFKHLSQKFHLIISNPPYVAPWEKSHHYEPYRALFAPMGWLFLKYVINQAPNYLLPNGKLCIEHSPMQVYLVRQFFYLRGYRMVRTIVDDSGKKRATMGTMVTQ